MRGEFPDICGTLVYPRRFEENELGIIASYTG